MAQESDFFKIRRLSPEEAERFQSAYIRPKLATQKSYHITNNEERYQFLYKVLNKELTVNEAAFLFGMNYTTAKNILTLYLKEGRIEKKKFRVRGKGKSKGKEEKIDTQQNYSSEEGFENKKKINKESPNSEFWASKLAQYTK